ncbi:DUF4192 domain-containing protein [Blastococcus sp. SYSU D00820]
MDDPLRPLVRISDPGEVAAALPHLLGFHPAESVVLVSLTRTDRRVGLTARADLPHPARACELARALTRSIATDAPDRVLLAVVSDAPDVRRPGDPAPQLPHRELVHAFVLALTDAGIPVPELLLVRRGRWWSYDCPHPCCAPGAGTPLPAGVTELAAASVAAGAVVERDRAALAARIAPVGGPAAGAMAAAVLRIGRDCATRALDGGPSPLAAESDAAVRAAVAACTPGARSAGTRLADAELARVLWGLRDPDVRDRALGLALGPQRAAAEVLWTECTRRAPVPLDAVPATLLAVSAWLRGDGALAGIALERALDSDPDLTLARLLADGLAACLPPAELRALLERTVADLEDGRAAG